MNALALNEVDHIGYAVGSLPEAIAQFESMGFDVMTRAELPQFGLEVAIMAASGQKVELVRTLDPERDRTRRGDREMVLDHIAYAVDDIQEVANELRTAGTAFTGPDGVPSDGPIEVGGRLHIWAGLGELRFQFVQSV